MHRDLKPANVLCADPRDALVLAEFYHPLRAYTMNACTVYYKSPELVFDYNLYDYAVDVWSAGVILLEALSGRWHAFDGADEEMPWAVARSSSGRGSTASRCPRRPRQFWAIARNGDL
jgi:serine/threonine protein kinase